MVNLSITSTFSTQRGTLRRRMKVRRSGRVTLVLPATTCHIFSARLLAISNESTSKSMLPVLVNRVCHTVMSSAFKSTLRATTFITVMSVTPSPVRRSTMTTEVWGSLLRKSAILSSCRNRLVTGFGAGTPDMAGFRRPFWTTSHHVRKSLLIRGTATCRGTYTCPCCHIWLSSLWNRSGGLGFCCCCGSWTSGGLCALGLDLHMT